MLSGSRFAALTSIVPSTTSSALTTLWTGRPPAEHGILGYEMWLKEYGLLANMIMHSVTSFVGDAGGLRRAGFQPETFLSLPTLGSHLVDLGVQPFAFQHASISQSGLSKMLMQNAKTLPFHTYSDLWTTLASILEANTDKKTYSYVYWGDIDYLSHRFAPDDERVALEFASFSLLLEHFVANQKRQERKDTLLIITSDHGMMPTPHHPSFELKNHPELIKCLAIPPSGENRFAYLFLRPGRETFLKEYTENTWHGQFHLLPSELILKSGLLGNRKIHPQALDRLGDWTAIPRGNAYWWWANKENHLLGRHGGLSSSEMLVPFITTVL